MASLFTENGKRVITFIMPDESRPKLRLGECSLADAKEIKSHIEHLVFILSHNTALRNTTADWLHGLDDRAYGRLADLQLVKPRINAAAGLGAFIDAYVATRPDCKQNTRENWTQVKQWLVKCFTESRDLRTIGPGEAEQFRDHMVKGGLAENTIRRHIGRARQLFKAAIRRGIVRGVNPFEGMTATVRADKARQFFVKADVAQKVIKACPDAQWRLMVALSRYGGVRCPSETLALRWGDIDWAQNRIRVPSCKTEHIEGHECRFIPLFPEIRPHLQSVYDEAPEGSEFIISRYRSGTSNLRTQLAKIITRAGLVPWPKPWHNMRSTRQTELAETYPIHVVCAWLGNSRAVAQEHYLQVTDSHFAQAVGAEQKAEHQSTEVSGNAGNAKAENEENTEKTAELATAGSESLPPTGFEPVYAD